MLSVTSCPCKLSVDDVTTRISRAKNQLMFWGIKKLLENNLIRVTQ